MRVEAPEFGLVLLVGPSGSGKSTFASRHFLPTEVVSSDFCRGIVSDDENSLEATTDAFDLVHKIIALRLKNRKFTVVDATNVQPEARRPLMQIAREHHALVTAIVFDVPERLCLDRNESRPERDFGPHVVRRQRATMRRGMRGLKREGFRYVHTLKSQEEVDAVEFVRTKIWNDRREETGPFDIVGDVHGCYEELVELFVKLGYKIDGSGDDVNVTAPEGRKAVFVGDLVDRGPDSPSVLRLVMSMVDAGSAIAVPGNHDDKLSRYLRGRDVKIAHGLEQTIEQLESESDDFKEKVKKFLSDLVSHYVLDGGKLVVAHAGMREVMQGRTSAAVRDFALYGETTGETDEFGLPVRYEWANEYRGRAVVVYGHTPVPEPEWINNTLNIDTGCVFGGRLTALRYPEREIVSVPAKETYADPVRPIEKKKQALSAQHELDDVLDMEDVLGKRIVQTSLHGGVTIREENALAALESMSRFAANPKWLVYLPPTMSPCATSDQEGYLERPEEAFGYFRRNGVDRVVCEEKHMGSRAVMAVAKSEEAILKRFGIESGGLGTVYTRTGRPFFNDKDVEQQLVSRVADAFEKAGLWRELESDWALLDCELMPWSAKAQELIRRQFAPVGSTADVAITRLASDLRAAKERGLEGASELFDATVDRLDAVQKYKDAYRVYCWSVNTLEDLKLAPFHLLATAGAVHTDKDNEWHMKTLARACAEDEGVMLSTRCRTVDLSNDDSVSQAIEWWESMVSTGGEGMVVKPFDFVVKHEGQLVQPAVKVRGPEYLRIIYGPEYLLPKNLDRLRKRGLNRKRGLAAREFALGIEGLERFVRGEPLRKIHECALGVLAMESEPVDTRL